jgi:hypothetical protein
VLSSLGLQPESLEECREQFVEEAEKAAVLREMFDVHGG